MHNDKAGWGMVWDGGSMGESVSIKWTKQATDHVFQTGQSSKVLFDTREHNLCRHLPCFVWHERDVFWIGETPDCKLPCCHHAVDKSELRDEMDYPLGPKLGVQQRDVAAAKVVRDQDVEVHVLDTTIIHAAAVPRREEKSHPVGMEHVAQIIPPLIEEALAKTPRCLAVALLVRTRVALCTQATW